jgi:hypothetical protein
MGDAPRLQGELVLLQPRDDFVLIHGHILSQIMSASGNAPIVGRQSVHQKLFSPLSDPGEHGGSRRPVIPA